VHGTPRETQEREDQLSKAPLTRVDPAVIIAFLFPPLRETKQRGGKRGNESFVCVTLERGVHVSRFIIIIIIIIFIIITT